MSFPALLNSHNNNFAKPKTATCIFNDNFICTNILYAPPWNKLMEGILNKWFVCFLIVLLK